MKVSTSSELEVMRKLRGVLKRSSRGMGLAGALVKEFSSSNDKMERRAMKHILLGRSPDEALTSLVSKSSTARGLVKFIASLTRFDSMEASKSADKLSLMFDRWTLQKERREQERKAMMLRGVIISAVAGVVVGMLSTFIPLISGFQMALSLTTQQVVPHSSFSSYEGALFLIPSALCLGSFLSTERPYLNMLLSLATFAGVVYFLGPLANFSLVG